MEAIVGYITMMLRWRSRCQAGDNGTEFKNTGLDDYLDELGITHELSTPYTPQQNGIVECKKLFLRWLALCLMNTRCWYVSNVSIIFDCSMLYYLLFWTILGFFFHFHIIFGTNLLTRGPVPVSVFLPILEFRRKGIPNGVQTEWNLRDDLYWTGSNPEDLESKSGTPRGGHKAGGRAQGGRRAPTFVGPS